ncbi:uncharacterized protein [Montipora capricornis]|uniref:uncharacterized protein n=1 Tax=Montipora capricornis TaxID=246305 RepID=UPI0035F179E5
MGSRPKKVVLRTLINLRSASFPAVMGLVEGYNISGTYRLKPKLETNILPTEGRKFDQNKSDKLCYFIDDLNLPVNTMLRLEKYYEPPLEYRLRPFHTYETEESPSLANDPIYFKTLEAEVLHSLQRIKHEIGTKRPLKANIWCQFGTVLIRQGDEGPGGEWSIENALRELVEGSEWKTLFRGGVNLDEKFVEQRLCNQSLPEYEDYQSNYELTFPTPNGGRLTFKVWVMKKNVGKTLESIIFPFTDLKNILDEVCFEDEFTSSRCRGWFFLPSQRYLRADILFPGCEFDCRLTIRALADSGFHMDFVPEDDIRSTLLRYLSKVTFSDEDEFGLRLPDEKLPDGFKLSFMRCSKRTVYRFSEDFSIILSKESTGMYGRDIKKETDVYMYLYCKEWDELLNSENWEPEEVIRKLPDFFCFVKKVQSSIMHKMKHEGATVWLWSEDSYGDSYSLEIVQLRFGFNRLTVPRA